MSASWNTEESANSQCGKSTFYSSSLNMELWTLNIIKVLTWNSVGKRRMLPSPTCWHCCWLFKGRFVSFVARKIWLSKTNIPTFPNFAKGCPWNLANMSAHYFDSKVRCSRVSFPTTTADPMNADQLYYGPEPCEFSPTTPTKLTYKVYREKVVLLGPHPWISDDR